MSDVERGVAEAAQRGVVVTLSVAELHPQRVLEILAEGGRSHRVTIEGPMGCITVELGNGLVVGAEAELRDGDASGRAAYARIRGIESGSMRIEPLRFPSLANILEPVAQMPDLERTSTPPPAGDDTIEVALPRARPIHAPSVREPQTLELELPVDVEELTVASPRASMPPPVPAAALPLLLEPTREHVAPPPRRRRVWAAAAAVVVLSLGGAGWALAPSSGEADRIAATTPQLVDLPSPTAETDEVDMDFSDRALAGDELAEARELARTARQHLQEGDRAAALIAARRAAELRGGMPYYQVLLGDALRANGQPAAARRAYRRAVRLRPRYGPAMRRLQRRAPEAPTSQT